MRGGNSPCPCCCCYCKQLEVWCHVVRKVHNDTFSVSKLTFKPNTIGFRDKIKWTPGLVEKCFNNDEIKWLKSSTTCLLPYNPELSFCALLYPVEIQPRAAWSIGQSLNQSVNQSANQSIGKSTYQSINLLKSTSHQSVNNFWRIGQLRNLRTDSEKRRKP